MPRPQPEQHAPPVQRLRVRYAKRGRARFTSHRDFGRAFERALRRAGVPMAYSSGFSPHPRISYANAAPTGAASEAEYLEIGLVEARDPEEVRRALDAALPPGLDVVEVTEAGANALADQLTGSRWTADLVGVQAADLEAAVDGVPGPDRGVGGADDQERAAHVRHPGPRSWRCRPRSAQLVMVLAHGVPLVRPDDVLAGLARVWPAFVPAEPPVLTRLSPGPAGPRDRSHRRAVSAIGLKHL